MERGAGRKPRVTDSCLDVPVCTMGLHCLHFYVFIYSAVLGLCSHMQFFSVVVCSLLIVTASLVRGATGLGEGAQ